MNEAKQLGLIPIDPKTQLQGATERDRIIKFTLDAMHEAKERGRRYERRRRY